MYVLVVISLLLSSVPAQSRTIQDLIENISGQTGDITEKDDIPVSTIIETNKNAGQELDEPLIKFGDIAVASGLENADPCTARGCKWDRSRDGNVYVPYVISYQYSLDEVSVIERGMQSFAEVSCIRFVPHQGERNFLRIQSHSGCYSYLGRQREGQVVSLQRPGCISHHTVQHELLHALGFHHEQNRSDRDQYIQILYENIYPEMQYNFNRADTNNLGTPYDYNSVMHYSRYAFSWNSEPTMIPIPDSNVVIGEAQEMSDNDILRINRLYCS
ncbi:low choriolytic enzyme-like isoform X2 [Ctenopharyngodon idella]|uniref:low choriolytic enzyme-like isoform X1 n=1 Tax=Ctenopharyngodon idella TaxID=7959 RepID=UPI00222E1F56|nr:low choriolytic enzyme-like isoform X1 [Ctenopharyngodon idella]XP_051757616.1 low choriolytic enzyme-like isoform X2 [Ctenopharyngodon idella]